MQVGFSPDLAEAPHEVVVSTFSKNKRCQGVQSCRRRKHVPIDAAYSSRNCEEPGCRLRACPDSGHVCRHLPRAQTQVLSGERFCAVLTQHACRGFLAVIRKQGRLPRRSRGVTCTSNVKEPNDLTRDEFTASITGILSRVSEAVCCTWSVTVAVEFFQFRPWSGCVSEW